MDLESNRLNLNTFLAKSLAGNLNRATNETPEFLEMDIDVTRRLLTCLLDYETIQSGLNLTHTQDRHFIQVKKLIDSFRFHLEILKNLMIVSENSHLK